MHKFFYILCEITMICAHICAIFVLILKSSFGVILNRGRANH